MLKLKDKIKTSYGEVDQIVFGGQNEYEVYQSKFTDPLENWVQTGRPVHWVPVFKSKTVKVWRDVSYGFIKMKVGAVEEVGKDYGAVEEVGKDYVAVDGYVVFGETYSTPITPYIPYREINSVPDERNYMNW